jgi:peptidoglycan hydrolase-like protein with peptidoglycan-binding domain
MSSKDAPPDRDRRGRGGASDERELQERRSEMRRVAFVAAALLGAAAYLPAPVAAQPPMQPTYEQKLSPQAIRDVQQRLRQSGFYSGEVDGVWGQSTQAALEKFQQNHNLQVTGSLNQSTLTILGMDPNTIVGQRTEAPTSSTAAAQPLDRPVVREIQARLRRQGFYSGGTDGVWGPGTQQALERFQRARGLQVTGDANPMTLSALGLDPNNLAAIRGGEGYGSSVPARR